MVPETGRQTNNLGTLEPWNLKKREPINSLPIQTGTPVELGCLLPYHLLLVMGLKRSVSAATDIYLSATQFTTKLKCKYKHAW